MDEIGKLEEDLAQLARLAAQESFEDVRLLLGRLVRKYRVTNPSLAERLDQSLRSSQARSGHSSIVRRGPAAGAEAPTELPVDADSKFSLIRVFDDRAGLAEPLLPDFVRNQLGAIISERKERDRLLARGLSPTRSAILVGPPGVGKTYSARWVAAQLGRPLWVLDLTTVMSSLLGKTGSNIRAALDHAKANEAVILLDEIDAIAKRRSDESDIGELKRLVTVILQEVDRWPDTGLLLAATNHPELIDPALWRRFDAILQFGNPSAEAVHSAVLRFLGPDRELFEPWIEILSSAFLETSLSDIERAITAMRRAAVLNHADPEILCAEMAAANIERLEQSQKLKIAVGLAKADYSHHFIHRLTGVSRDTIRKHAGPSVRKGRGRK